jgi:hypothetical protein
MWLEVISVERRAVVLNMMQDWIKCIREGEKRKISQSNEFGISINI